MQLERFKLIDGGVGGISITCYELIRGKNNIIFKDYVTRTRTVPFPLKFKLNIQKLKYYFLVLTAHWIEPFDKYYDRLNHVTLPLPETSAVPMGQTILKEIMNKVSITGVIFEGNGFRITGFLDTVGGKKIGIATSIVTEEDDAGFFNEAKEMIKSTFSDVGLFFKEGMVIEDSPRSYLDDLGYKDEENLGDLSEAELVERAVDAIQKRGGIIIMPEDGNIELDNLVDNKLDIFPADQVGDVKTTLDTRTGNIDGKHLQEVGEDNTAKIDPEKEIEKFKEEKINKEKHAGNSSKEPTQEVSKSVDSDREFPQEGISDDDIKAAVGPVTEEISEEVIPPVKTKKKKAGSTLASEKDFAAATGEEVRDDAPVDLGNAEFSEDQSPEVDDWSQDVPVNEESGISQEDLDSATQG